MGRMPEAVSKGWCGAWCPKYVEGMRRDVDNEKFGIAWERRITYSITDDSTGSRDNEGTFRMCWLPAQSTRSMSPSSLFASFSFSITSFLTHIQVDINICDEKGRSLVAQALSPFSRGSLAQLKYLVEKKGANCNKADMDGKSPLVCNSPLTLLLHFIPPHSLYPHHLRVTHNNISMFSQKPTMRKRRTRRNIVIIMTKQGYVLQRSW